MTTLISSILKNGNTTSPWQVEEITNSKSTKTTDQPHGPAILLSTFAPSSLKTKLVATKSETDTHTNFGAVVQSSIALLVSIMDVHEPQMEIITSIQS